MQASGPCRVELRSTVSRALAALLLAAAVLVGFVAEAGAHAVLETATPFADEELPAPPQEVRLEFNESVTATPESIRLIDPAGEEVGGIRAAADGSVLWAELPELDLAGSYTVGWRAVSADGHPISGAYLFHVTERTLTEPADVVEGGGDLLPKILRAAGAVLAFAAVAALIGGLPGRGRWWAVALAGTALSVAGAVVAVGSGWWDSVLIVYDTTSGRFSFIALLVAAIGVALVPVRSPMPSTVLASALTILLAAQGHAVSLEPVWKSLSLTVLHVVAAVGWAAGLLYLERRSTVDDPATLAGRVLRFSPWAAGAVVLLAFSGVVLVLDRVPLDDLFGSEYGVLAVVKIVLLAAALVLVGLNRWRYTPALEGDAPATEDRASTMDQAGSSGAAAAGRLRTGLHAEVVVLVLALVAGGVLAQVPPPQDGASGGLIAERVDFGPGVLDLTIEPGLRGTNEMHVIALGEDGRLMGGIEGLAVQLSLPAQDLGPLEPDMIVISVGHSLTYADFPLDGEWEVTVTAKASEFEEYSAEINVDIGR